MLLFYCLYDFYNVYVCSIAEGEEEEDGESEYEEQEIEVTDSEAEEEVEREGNQRKLPRRRDLYTICKDNGMAIIRIF